MIDLTHGHQPIVDKRGVIVDLAYDTQINAVTHLFSVAGAQRANHYHNFTEQFNLITIGSLVLAPRPDFDSDITYTHFSTNSFFKIEQQEHHGMYFLEDTNLVVMTIGPRCGKDYESDTVRLDSSLFNI